MLWGRRIGAVSWIKERDIGVFQYAPEFVQSNIQVAPLTMPLRLTPYEFPTLARGTFSGLPGLLADSLPDKFGNALIDAWLARIGRSPQSFNPVERLCYLGKRGMGALEFQPVMPKRNSGDVELNVAELVSLANQVLSQRQQLSVTLTGKDDRAPIEDIIRVGTSAGGARAKAIVAWNSQTDEFRSGQVNQDSGFSNWLIKFDGVSGNRDKELADPQGYGKIEFAYYLMALDAGINMSESRLHHEGGRAHFMTQRFDRTDSGQKLHMQSLGAIMHYDFNQAGVYSYEQALLVIARLDLSMVEREQQFRRTVFNVLARNQDDHVKNIAYLMDKAGQWRLAPAFDMVYSYNPDGAWTGMHQMSINGKRGAFVVGDLLALAMSAGIKARLAKGIISEVTEAVSNWASFAVEADVAKNAVIKIKRTHRRLDIS
ncbi:MAG: serine/threonine-protein kinase HipA [Arenicella sp.]|jgi:serine/threonine-protein kinase HipA